MSFLRLQLLVSGCEGSVRESACFKGVYLDVVLSLRTSRRQCLRSSFPAVEQFGLGVGVAGWDGRGGGCLLNFWVDILVFVGLELHGDA